MPTCHTCWENSEDLGLVQELAKEWNPYVDLLKSNFIYLKEEETYLLVWTKNHVNDIYTVKLGYHTLAEEDFHNLIHWWWEYI
jgi:hypothetical protein